MVTSGVGPRKSIGDGLRMAVSSILSDAKAVVFNHSECLRTHHERPPPTPTPRAHSHHQNAWELQTQPHVVRWLRSRVGDLFMMIFVEVRPANDIRVELPHANDAKP